MSALTNEYGGRATGSYVARWLSEHPDEALAALVELRVARPWTARHWPGHWYRERLGHHGYAVEVRPTDAPGRYVAEIHEPHGETLMAVADGIVHVAEALAYVDAAMRDRGWGLLGASPSRAELCLYCAGTGQIPEAQQVAGCATTCPYCRGEQ